MEHLLDAICRTGTTCQCVCEWCGRTHFVDPGYYTGDWEEGELEDLRKKHAENPNEYVRWDDRDAISWGLFCGKQTVYECPCNEEKLKQYVDHYWRHKEILTKFLKNRAIEELTVAKVRFELLEAIGNTALEAEKAMDDMFYNKRAAI